MDGWIIRTETQCSWFPESLDDKVAALYWIYECFVLNTKLTQINDKHKSGLIQDWKVRLSKTPFTQSLAVTAGISSNIPFFFTFYLQYFWNNSAPAVTVICRLLVFLPPVFQELSHYLWPRLLMDPGCCLPHQSPLFSEKFVPGISRNEERAAREHLQHRLHVCVWGEEHKST